MENADSAAAASSEKVFLRDPTDTLRIHSLFDTGFIFPARCEASMPFAFDEDYRDDTLFRKSYGNGLFEQEHPCVETWVLSGDFPHPAKWLHAGMKQREFTSSLGRPAMKHANQLRYLWHSAPGEDGDSLVRYESMRFYFENDSLYAALLQRSKPCF